MQFHRHKTDAALEGVVSDACYTARDRHFRQTGAVLEGRGADTGHVVGDRYLTAVAEISRQHAVVNLKIAGSTDALQPGRAGEICFISGGILVVSSSRHIDSLQFGHRSKGTVRIRQCRYRQAGESDFRDTAHSFKRTIGIIRSGRINRCYTFADHQRRYILHATEYTRLQRLQHIRYHQLTGKPAAALECIRSQRC